MFVVLYIAILIAIAFWFANWRRDIRQQLANIQLCLERIEELLKTR